MLAASQISAQNNFSHLLVDGVYKFNDLTHVKKSEIFTQYKSYFGFNNNSSLVKTAEGSTDSVGGVGTKYVQYFNGYLVEGTMMNVISQYGIVRYVNGFSLPSLNVNLNYSVSDSQALNEALQYVDAPKYAWEDTMLEYALKIKIDPQTADSVIDTTLSYFPKGELVIAHPNDTADFENTSKYALCWKYMITPMYWDTVVIDTNTIDTIPHYDTVAKYVKHPNVIVYVNAITGQVFKMDSNRRHGSFINRILDPSIYHGVQDIQVWRKTIGKRKYLKDQKNINAEDFQDQGKIWGTNADGERWTGSTPTCSYWCLQKAHKYFGERHGFVNGPNSCTTDPILKPQNNEQKLYVNYRESSDPTRHGMFYQNGVGTRDDYYISVDNLSATGDHQRSIAYLDFMGHEYTHAIIHAGPDFQNIGEAAAIAEGFCDYFGVYVATAAYPSRYLTDWTSGFGYSYNRGNIRKFADPTSDDYNSLDRYNAADVLFSNVERGSGVLRKVLGLSEWGGLHYGINVTAIPNPLTDVFVTMFWWSWSNMNYGNLRGAFMDEYEYYYGACSPRWNSIARAWASVGVGNIPFCSRVWADGPGVIPTVFNTNGNVYINTATGPKPGVGIHSTDPEDQSNILSYNWVIPQGWSTSYPNPQDLSEIRIDSVADLSAKYIKCVVVYNDSTSDTVTKAIHFVGENYETYNQQRQLPNDKYNADVAAQSSKIVIYPNPSNRTLNIELPFLPEKAIKMVLIDMTGREVYSGLLTSQYSITHLPELPSGIYIIKVKGKDQDYIQRIMVQQ